MHIYVPKYAVVRNRERDRDKKIETEIDKDRQRETERGGERESKNFLLNSI